MSSAFDFKNCDLLNVNFVYYNNDNSLPCFDNFTYINGYVLAKTNEYFFVALGISTSDPEKVDPSSSFLVCYTILIIENSTEDCPIEFWDTYWLYNNQKKIYAFIPTRKGKVIHPETEEYRSGMGFKIPECFNLRKMLQGVTSHTIDRNNNVSVNCKEGSIWNRYWNGYWNIFEPDCEKISITIPPKPPLLKANEIKDMILQKESDIQVMQNKLDQLQRDMGLLKTQQKKLEAELAIVNK